MYIDGHFFLDDNELHTLQMVLQDPEEKWDIKLRAQSLLWLNEGLSVESIAEHTEIPTEIIRRWAWAFRTRINQPPLQRLRNAHRVGPPPKKVLAVLTVLEELQDKNPKLWRLPLPSWNVKLLQHYLHQRGIKVSKETLRKALRTAEIFQSDS